MKLQGFLQVRESLFFGLALAGDIDFQALRNVPSPFPPDSRSKRSPHVNILSHGGRLSHAHGADPIQDRRYPLLC